MYVFFAIDVHSEKRNFEVENSYDTYVVSLFSLLKYIMKEKCSIKLKISLQSIRFLANHFDPYMQLKI